MNKNLTENEVDDLVILQADDEDAWEKPIHVNRKPTFFLNLPLAFEIDSDKDILRGTPVFRGTRVPNSALLDNLENGVYWTNLSRTFPPLNANKPLGF